MGRAISLGLAAEGARVAVNCRRGEATATFPTTSCSGGSRRWQPSASTWKSAAGSTKRWLSSRRPTWQSNTADRRRSNCPRRFLNVSATSRFS
ncbi:MAG: hypothetical protein ACOX1P_18255 [Thermoguttaceae bacterium]